MLRNVVNLHFVAEVSTEVVRDQLELFSLSEEERNIIFGSPRFCRLSLPKFRKEHVCKQTVTQATIITTGSNRNTKFITITC